MTDLLTGHSLSALTTLPGIGTKRAAAPATHFHSWDALRDASPQALTGVLGARLAAQVHPHLSAPLTAPALPDGISVISCFEPDYPARLLAIPDAPVLLWVMGTLPPPQAPALAVVGTRHPTGYGTAVDTRASAEAARRGVSHISGLAPGVDLLGAQAALDAGGRSWAVLGCGVDTVGGPGAKGGPVSAGGAHGAGVRAEAAARLIATGGGLLSEVPSGTPTAAHLLTRRNRLQSGLSDAVLLAQSGLPGAAPAGAMHTARYAVEQARTLVLPRPHGRWATEERSAGNLALTDADGCAPALIYASGALAQVVAARTPVADVVLHRGEDLAQVWPGLDEVAQRWAASPWASGLTAGPSQTVLSVQEALL